MPITIVGAGPIGGLAGAFMWRAGESVQLIDASPAIVDAINRDGLRVVGVKGEFAAKIAAMRPSEVRDPLKEVFLAVRSGDTRAAVAEIAPLLADDGYVVSLQNGQNEEHIAEVVGRDRTVGALPDYGGRPLEAGLLEFSFPGPVYVGELDGRDTERVQAIQRLLSNLTTCHITDNIIGRVWLKQVYMTQFVMTALMDAPTREVLADRRNRLMGIALVREAVAVPLTLGVHLPIDPLFDYRMYASRDPSVVEATSERMLQLTSNLARAATESTHRFARFASGIWWDLAVHHRPSETPYITGELIRRGAEIGVRLPLNAACATMIYEIESGKRSMSPDNLSELAAFMKRHGESLE
jgi:2-dehydropantoate 2-reductase